MYNETAAPLGIGIILVVAFCVLCVAIYPGNMPRYHADTTICTKQNTGTQKGPVYVIRSSKTAYTIRNASSVKVDGKTLKPSEAFARFQPGTRYELTVYKDDNGVRYIDTATRFPHQDQVRFSGQHC